MHASRVVLTAEVERVVVTTADGRTYDLGAPTSPLFRLRVLTYRIRRRIHG